MGRTPFNSGFSRKVREKHLEFRGSLNQCHLLKQISVKKQKSAFLLPLTQIFLGSILKKLDIEKKMCGVFLIKIRKTPINQEI